MGCGGIRPRLCCARSTLPPHDLWERGLRAGGFPLIAGVDEAGRGPLAGPVSAAAVILDPADVPDGIDDSKALSADERDSLCAAILARALAVGVGLASADEIDAVNIRQATFAAMRRAVRALPLAPHHLLVDGRDIPPGLPCPARALVKGDSLSLSIAAASIVAKVTRDRLMVRLHASHPAYGFETHKGYPTAAHRAAIAAHGPTPYHRRSFGVLRRDP